MSLSTREVFPAYHSNNTTEFHFPSGVKLSNVRLIGLGCTKVLEGNPDPAQDTENPGYSYIKPLGVGGLIRRIVLYDGQTVLQEVNNASFIYGFNSFLQSKGRDNGLDWLYSHLDGSSHGMFVNDEKIYDVLSDATITSDELTTFKGHVQLSRFFSLLKSIGVLDTGVFQSLRLLIEWETDVNKFVSGLCTTFVLDDILAPTMLYDETSADMPTTVVFGNFESETLTLRSGAAGDVADTDVLLQTATGKFLNRVLISVVPNITNADPNDEYKQMISHALNNESFNLYVNSLPLVPWSGIDNDARKSSYLSQAWGNFNFPFGSQCVFSATIDDSYFDGAAHVVSNLSFGGVSVNKRIDTLQLKHHYTVDVANLIYSLTVYHEIAKVLTVDKGAYNVLYV